LAECQKYWSDCQLSWFTDEQPPHEVNLSAFWIDETEVTNKMYSLCVAAGTCKEPSNTSSKTHSSYYGNSEFEDYPVIYVDWNMAKTYCEWRGDRLPTEAEWEKAASWNEGNQTKRVYPWGNSLDCTFANYYDKKNGRYCVGDTSAVKSYESGKSFYGAYDMAGNVWEWMNDWYSETYYQNSPLLNPLGPDAGDYRVLRGGSWGSFVTYRSILDPTSSDFISGFRCARSP
jgi:formylglycine-generating enzyme required for sulfatase activity